MLARNLILTTLFVLATGAMASDKPAVQARERMDAEARGVTTAVVAERGYTHGAVPLAPNTATKPAVAYRLAKEAGPAATYTGETAMAVATGEEHPIANVGYRAVAQPQAEVHVVRPDWATTATKPAVQARMRMEEGR